MLTPTFVLLEKAVLPDEMMLVDALRRRHPDHSWEPGSTIMSTRPSDDAILIRAGDHLMVIMVNPTPMPFDKELWRAASWLWPEAPDMVARHQAHLLVSPLASAVDGSQLELGVMADTALTTALVGGLVEATTGCLGVVWRGRVGRSPEMWLDQSRSAFSPYPDQPFALWIEILPYRSGKTLGAITVGLAAFTGREIEFEVDGLDQGTSAARVAQLSAYLIGNGLENGPKSGEVFSADSEIDHPVAVLHRNSRFNIGPVVSFSSLDDLSGRSRTYPIFPPAIAHDHPLLVMLGKVGLFDPAGAENQITLKPDHYVSDERLDSFDRGLSQELSKMIATDSYSEADTNARRALASGNTESARSILQPWAEEVAKFQLALKLGLTMCDLFLFMPAPYRGL